MLTDGNHVIELHHLRGSGHNEGLIVAYLPEGEDPRGSRCLQPACRSRQRRRRPRSVPYTANLVEHIDRLKLDVQRIIPIHYPADNRNVSIAELMKVVGRSN